MCKYCNQRAIFATTAAKLTVSTQVGKLRVAAAILLGMCCVVPRQRWSLPTTSKTGVAAACISLGERTSEGFFRIKGGLESAIARGLAYAPYADLVWFEVGLLLLTDVMMHLKVNKSCVFVHICEL